jgi:hypothetical protein
MKPADSRITQLVTARSSAERRDRRVNMELLVVMLPNGDEDLVCCGLQQDAPDPLQKLVQKQKES